MTEPLGVDDPFGGNLDVYRACRDELVKKIGELLDENG